MTRRDVSSPVSRPRFLRTLQRKGPCLSGWKCRQLEKLLARPRQDPCMTSGSMGRHRINERQNYCRVRGEGRVSCTRRLTRTEDTQGDTEGAPRDGATQDPSWGHPRCGLGAVGAVLEPFLGRLSPKIDKVSCKLTFEMSTRGSHDPEGPQTQTAHIDVAQGTPTQVARGTPTQSHLSPSILAYQDDSTMVRL